MDDFGGEARVKNTRDHRLAWPDRRIAALAARQRALITHRQLQYLGIGGPEIARACRRGRLHRIHHGVYALVEVPALPPLAREQAAILACGPRALIGHDSLAAIWNLRPPHTATVELTLVGGEAGRTRAGITVHRVQRLDPRDRRRHRSLPVIAPARLLLDLVPRLTDRELERATDEALVRRLTSRTAIIDMLDRYPRRTGVGRLRELVQTSHHTTFTRSEAEERLLALVRKGGLPSPELNAMVGSSEVDFLWRRERVIVEVDGYAFHSSHQAFERDHERDATLGMSGMRVIRITWTQLTREPETVLVWIATALARSSTGRH